MTGRARPRLAIPPQARSQRPSSRRFIAGGQGEWSVATRSMRPASSAVQSSSRLAEQRMGGAHLNSVAAVRNLFGGKPEILYAGFDRDRHAAVARVCEEIAKLSRWRDARRGWAFGIPRRAGSAGGWLRPQRRRDARRDRWSICANPRRSALSAVGCGFERGWRLRRGPEAANSLHEFVEGQPQVALIHPGEAVDAGVDHEALESGNSGLDKRRQLLGISVDDAPPCGPVDPYVALAAARLASSAATLIVSGTQLRGMSTSVVTPPAAAARVAVPKPSQSRPGSLMCTCESTSPGKRSRSPKSWCCSAPVVIVPGANCRDLLAVR